MENLVSIAVPAHNCRETIFACIESLKKQTYTNTEIILINDNTTDLTVVKEKYPDIRIADVMQMGASAARNEGIKQCLGEYIVFVDSDDEIDKDYVKDLYSAACENPEALVMCGMWVRGNGTDERRVYSQMQPVTKLKREELAKVYEKYLLSSPTNKIYSRHIINKYGLYFNTRYKAGEDLTFNLEYIRHVSELAVVNKPLYIYNISNTGTLHSQCDIEKFEMLCDTYNTMCEFVKDEKGREIIERLVCCDFIYSVDRYFMTNRVSAAELKKILAKREYKIISKYIGEVGEDKRLSGLLMKKNPYILAFYFILKKIKHLHIKKHF